ncbi:Fatty acyl-CoA elongase/Polyunsaturated fatty acid specific elongation enzyme [Umbelopsis sp. WA50703]
MASFSLERPFGVYLWDYFSQTYELIVGKPAETFSFVQGLTPLSTNNEVIVACVTYLVVIFGGQALMREQSPFKFKVLFQIHNLLLTAVSFILLVLLIEELIPIVAKNGIFYAICSPQAWTQKLELLYYLNYLVKYWELFDTVFLVVKKKKLEFLHWFHHSMTALLCYTQLVGSTTVSWVPIVLNLTVHVLMYWYYFRTAGGAKIWWKKYLTTMQIIQFVIDLFVIYFCTYTHFAYTYSSLPTLGDCSGSENAAYFGCALLSSYLLLFINFYAKTYQKKAADKKAADKKAAAAPTSENGSSKKKGGKSKKV